MQHHTKSFSDLQSSIMNNSVDSSGKGKNSSNPRPGQSPFPQMTGSIRQTSTSPQERQPYTSSYSNNFDRESARFSTGRAVAGSQYRPESAFPRPLRLPEPPQGGQEEREESIYGMYGDERTPREAPTQAHQQQRRAAQQVEAEDSADEEVPRQADPRPQRPRFERQPSRSGPSRYNSRRDQRSAPRTERRSDQRNDERNNERHSERRGDQRNRQREEENGNRSYRHVNINIDTGTGGGGSSQTYHSEGSFGRTDINIGTPFGDGGFPFGGRNNNGGGRLPVNMPFNLPINLPFGL